VVEENQRAAELVEGRRTRLVGVASRVPVGLFAALAFAANGCGQAGAAGGTLSQPRLQPMAAECGLDALDCCPPDEPGRVSQCRLFAELVDLRALARRPRPDFTTEMHSSFDRSSEHATPNDPAWFANRDFAELTPGEPLVLLDVDGPGVVTRIWSANPSGVLRVFIDGDLQPLVEAPMQQLLQGLLPNMSDAFAFEAGSGSNLYVPLAFRRHCKITVTSPAKRLFYQISLRRYAAGTWLEPSGRDWLDATRGPGAMVARTLDAVGRGAPPPLAAKPERRVVRVADCGAGRELRIEAEADGGMLRELSVVLGPTDDAALRGSVLRVSVDGEPTVEAPLGDFFGSGPGWQDVHALPLGIDAAARRLSSRWPMPFRSELRLQLMAASGTQLTAACELVYDPARFGPDSLLFHARGRAPEWHANEPTHEYRLAELRGDGFYVGTLLNVTNLEPGWWGEGDEKIWLDDETFPSFFGTGTEDYFGFGWCSNQRFSRPFIGQTLAGPFANYGRASLYRFHVPDPLRFRENLRFDWEVNHWSKSGGMLAHDSVVYFYARPGATSSAADGGEESIPELPDEAPAGASAGPYRCGGD
jgi:hypothetical protein